MLFAFSTVCFVAMWAAASMQPAYAYLDPGTGSMMLQGIIGAVAAAGAVVSMYFSRIKAWKQKTLGRDRTPKKPELPEH